MRVAEEPGLPATEAGKERRIAPQVYHDERKLLIICHEPHPRKIVDKGCLSDIAEHLKMNGFIEEQDSEHS
jgi:hypothetical protein